MDALAIAKWDLEQRLIALRQELHHWMQLSMKKSDKNPFLTHNSQIRSFAGLILCLYREIRRTLQQPDFDAADAREMNKSVLALFRIWEFLRNKLAQRLDERLERYLQLADEFAWICYEPVHAKGYKQPPLVFLNGGFSPFMVSRNEAFQAEVVPQELIEDE